MQFLLHIRAWLSMYIQASFHILCVCRLHVLTTPTLTWTAKRHACNGPAWKIIIQTCTYTTLSHICPKLHFSATGVDYTHSDLGSCSKPGDPEPCRVAYARDFAPNDYVRDDSSRHGTNVAAVIARLAPKSKVGRGGVVSWRWVGILMGRGAWHGCVAGVATRLAARSEVGGS